MNLCFINELGPNFKGQYVYEFIFTDNLKNVIGEDWDSNPSMSKPQPPSLEFISSVGILSKNDLEFSLAQDSEYFSFIDCIDNVLALAWEKETEDEFSERLVFQFGETMESVKDKLYSRDIVLNYENEKTTN